MTARARRLVARGFSLSMVALGVFVVVVAGAVLGTRSQAASSPFAPPFTTKIGTFQEGSWFLDLNGDGRWDGCAVDRCLTFGAPGDRPVVGIWNADEPEVSVGVYRPATNQWLLDFNHNGSLDGCDIDRCINGFLSPDPANVPVVGRWDGGKAHKIGIFRNGTWSLDLNGNGVFEGPQVDVSASLGQAGDVPVVGRWLASQTHDTTGVFRAGSFFLDGNGSFSWDFDCSIDLCKSFGAAGDVPVAGTRWIAGGSADSTTQIGTFSGTTWHLDTSGDFAFNDCVADACTSAFGDATQVPIAGAWPAIRWTAGADQKLGDLGNYQWESASAVVPPGHPSCPGGAMIISRNDGMVGRADLGCLGQAGCFSFKSMPVASNEVLPNNGDAQMSWTPTNQLIHTRSGYRYSSADASGRLLDLRVPMFVFQSQDCGQTWTQRTAVDPGSNGILGAKCGLRQGMTNVLAVFRPPVAGAAAPADGGQVFIDDNRNGLLDDAARALNLFIQPGPPNNDQIVVGDWEGQTLVDKQRTRIGRFRSGAWTLDTSGDFQDSGCSVDTCFSFGQAGDVAVVGRWNSTSPDLKHQVGVFRNGLWILDANGNRVEDAGDATFNLGQAGDRPVVGDWGNTGTIGRNTRVGVYRPSENTWFLDQGPLGWQGCGTDLCVVGTFGDSSMTPMAVLTSQSPNIRDGIAMFQNGQWFIDTDDSRSWSGCGPDQCLNYGLAGDTPLPGQWRADHGGWDRPEMYSDPFNGMFYATMSCDYRDGSDRPQVLAFSTDGAATWSAQAIPGGSWATYMTSVNGGKLYLVAGRGRDTLLWPATVNKNAATVNIHSSIVVDSTTVPAPIPDVGWLGLSRVGRNGSQDVILVSTPQPMSQAGGTSVGLNVRRVAVNTTASGVSGAASATVALLTAPAAPQTLAEATMIEGPPGSSTSLLYWRRVSDKNSPTTALVRAEGILIRDSAAGGPTWKSSVFPLSRTAAGASRAWTGYNRTGDYIKAGAFGSPPRFLVQWSEIQDSSAHASVVQILQP
jgi:hypothetical protein